MRHHTVRARPRRAGARLAALGLAASALVFSIEPAQSAVHADGPVEQTPSVLVPVEPCRLLDTRADTRLDAAGWIDVQVVDECGVAADAIAAALTVVIVGPDARGFASMGPKGGDTTSSSTVNYLPGQVISNMQITQLADGGVTVFTLASADVVLDVTGYFVSAPDGASSGRFVAIDAYRAVDTRETVRPEPGASVRVEPDVPLDAIAVAVNLTSTGGDGPDFFTVHAAGEDRPLASSLNIDSVGQTRAAPAIVPINESGFDVYTLSGSHVIVDVIGYFTGSSAELSDEGLFVGIAPVRLVDTRDPYGDFGGPRLWDRGSRDFMVDGVTGGPVAAIAANITVTGTEDPGYIQARPARTEPTSTSSVNFDSASRTIANGAIVPVSEFGVSFWGLEATHLVIDVTGWFTGMPAESSGVLPNNPEPTDRRVTIISDSAMAGVRWNGALGGFQGFDADARLESCRRLVQSSCQGREGYRPRTARGEIASLPTAGPEDILVIAVGYNDWYGRFSSDFDSVVSAARAKGFHHIAWVNYRSNVGYRLPGTGGQVSNYGAMNAVLSAKLDSGSFPDVRLWDFDTYTAASVGWFASDGVHETTLGSWGVADWLSRHVRAFDDRRCMQPWHVGGPIADPCLNPDQLPATLGMPAIGDLYGL